MQLLFVCLIDLLEVCDPENISSIVAAEKQLKDGGGEFDEDLALIADDEYKIKVSGKSDDSGEDFGDEEEEDNEIDDFGDEEEEENDFDDFEDEDSVEEEEDLSEEENENSTRKSKRKNRAQEIDTDSENGDSKRKQKRTKVDKKEAFSSDESCEESENGESDSENENKEGTWTDIYGRLRGKDGSIIEESSEKYIPPAKRAEMAAGLSENKKAAEKLLRLQRQLKGLYTIFLTKFLNCIFVNNIEGT